MSRHQQEAAGPIDVPDLQQLGGATALFMLLGNQQAQARITEIHNTPNPDLNIITYRYDADGASFTDTYTQNRQHDPAAYDINDTIPVIHSMWAPSIKMTQAAYDAATPTLKALLGVLTVQDCEAAAGVRRDFYQCMSSDYNHVYACGKAHPFEP